MSGWVGGWLDITPIINPIHSPTFLIKTSKILTQVEIASWSWVWQLSETFKKLSNNLKTPSKHMPDTFPISFPHLLDTFQSFSRLLQKASIPQPKSLLFTKFVQSVGLILRGSRAYDILVHNHATLWSNLQDCKISSWADIPQLDPSVVITD